MQVYRQIERQIVGQIDKQINSKIDKDLSPVDAFVKHSSSAIDIKTVLMNMQVNKQIEDR